MLPPLRPVVPKESRRWESTVHQVSLYTRLAAPKLIHFSISVPVSTTLSSRNGTTAVHHRPQLSPLMSAARVVVAAVAATPSVTFTKKADGKDSLSYPARMQFAAGANRVAQSWFGGAG